MKPIRWNLFTQACPVHQSMGLWRHPLNKTDSYNSLDYWVEIAQKLEKAKFDGVFIADVLGVYDTYGNSADAALRSAVQVPGIDPLCFIAAMAKETTNLGFGVTINLSYEEPYVLARQITTLDHLTKGRIGWNVVTGYLKSGARTNSVEGQLTSHDQRYDMADEYMDIVYRLWEQSWDDNAVVRDKATCTYVDPRKVHNIRYDGKYLAINVPFMCEPSPQRTPVIYQAGTSKRGIQFAVKHAECIFVSLPTKATMKAGVDKLQSALDMHHRQRDSLIIYALLGVIVAETDVEAQKRYEEYKQYADRVGPLALMSGWTGLDLSELNLDDEVKYIKNNSMQTAVERFTVMDPNKNWTVREIAEHLSIGGVAPIIVGSPKTVCDKLEQLVDETGVDGFNLVQLVEPQAMDAFIELVVPELQRRGRMQTAYDPGTLRKKLFHGSSYSTLARDVVNAGTQ